MFKRSLLCIVAAVVLVLAACAPFVSSGGQGEILVYLGGTSGSRALSDPPFEELPVFSSFTIRVSGPGMAPVEFTVDSSRSSFSAMVPGGSDRVVELYAPVDWVATEIAYAEYTSLMPTLVKAYGATATVDVVPGQRVTATLKLEVAETKILLPDVYSDGFLAAVDSVSYSGELSGGYFSFGQSSDFEFDRYGRLIFSGNGELTIITSFDYDTGYIGNGEDSSSSISINKQSNKLYVLSNSQVLEFDLSIDEPVDVAVAVPSGYSLMGMGLASDTSGNLYTYASRGSVPTEYGVLKFSSANPLSFAFASEGSLGITNLDIRDMTVKDGKLYILAGRNVWTGYTTHHGKLVEVDPTSLTKTRELGVSPGIYPSNPEVQFYGPQRFIALKPRKLVIADEGLVAVNAQIDRIVEVDLESWSFSQTRDVTADISFFHAYSFC